MDAEYTGKIQTIDYRKVVLPWLLHIICYKDRFGFFF